MGSESTYSECETFTDEDTGTLVPPFWGLVYGSVYYDWWSQD